MNQPLYRRVQDELIEAILRNSAPAGTRLPSLRRLAKDLGVSRITVEAAYEALDGQGGAEITVSNHPLCIAPGNPAVTARSKKLSYKDHGMSWELSGKNGFFSPFQYAA